MCFIDEEISKDKEIKILKEEVARLNERVKFLEKYKSTCEYVIANLIEDSLSEKKNVSEKSKGKDQYSFGGSDHIWM